MEHEFFRRALLLGTVSLLTPTLTAPALAADGVTEVLIIGDAIEFRNRTADINPVLSYDLEYFQRFEPVSVGEMLKRVPGVTFTSDVLEYDGVQIRGLSPEYSQIMINGRRMPGAENDRSFFVDRIPAEMVESIEIIRSPRADMPSEGIGGTLNVILKEGASLTGGFAKIGGIMNEDGELRGSAAVAYAGQFGNGNTSYWAALNYQGRRNPKEKLTLFYDGDFEELAGREFQDDTRDGVDISGNLDITHGFDMGHVRLSGFFVDTDRDENEVSIVEEFDDGAFELDEVETQHEDISQQTYSLLGEGEFDIGIGTFGLNGSFAGFREETAGLTQGGDDFDDLEPDERETIDTEDDEWGAGAFYAYKGGSFDARLGLDALFKNRDGANRVFAWNDDDEIFEDETAPGGIYTIEETRIDPFARVTFTPMDFMSLDLGLRFESTDRTVSSDDGAVDFQDESWNPSAHLRLSPTDRDQIRLSVAKTVRRPGYDFLAPALQPEEPADEDALRGNPGLLNETAWGVDLGYEREFGTTGMGIFGVNLFYRHIDDLIELTNTGLPSDDGGNIYTPTNVGDGFTYGIEFDVSTPLDFLGLPDTGVFANFTYLESDVKDPVTGNTRPFRNQPNKVYNVGLIHSINDWDVSFGGTLSGRDEGFEYALDETVITTYDDDLELFVEKRFGGRFVLRFTAGNLLDREKHEHFRIYDGDSVQDIIDAKIAGDVDESEFETEHAGAIFQLTLRAAF